MLEFIKGESHLDHGLTGEHIYWLRAWYDELEGLGELSPGVDVRTLEMPDALSSLNCDLYGPNMRDLPVDEDRVVYTIRPGRKHTSRIVDCHPRPSRFVTVVTGPYQDKPRVLYTAYGGPAAPREPGDITIATWEEVLVSRAFWKEHALAAG